MVGESVDGASVLPCVDSGVDGVVGVVGAGARDFKRDFIEKINR